jgi:imidazole glycerol-phosphate synthase subunit HisF
MPAKRIIVQLLLKGKRLVKGTGFSRFIDVGDPISQAMIFEAQGADEIMVVDIEASHSKRLIDGSLIKKMIKNCYVPLAAGGGVQTLADARKILFAGADKIIINTAAIENPLIIKKISRVFGSQSVVISIDVRRRGGLYEIFGNSGKTRSQWKFLEYLKLVQELGAGEIIITSIDREGTTRGFDIELISLAKENSRVPIIAAGGAGNYGDFVDVFQKTNADAAALGKMLFLRDYDIIKIKSFLKNYRINVRKA